MMSEMYLFYTCATVSHGVCLYLGAQLGISKNSKHSHSWLLFCLLWSLMDFCRILVELSRENRGAFHSTKPFENVETAANGTEISRKSFQKFRKLLNFRNVNHSTENSRNSGRYVEWKENFRERNFDSLGIPR